MSKDCQRGMMDHNNTDNNTHGKTDDTSKQTENLSQSHTKTEALQHDFLIADKASKVQPRSMLILVLIVAFTFVLGILIFSYIYDIAGIRTFATEHDDAVIEKKLAQVTKTHLHNGNDDNDDTGLNASKQVQKIQQKVHQEKIDVMDLDVGTLSDESNNADSDVKSDDTMHDNSLLKINNMSLGMPQNNIVDQKKITKLHHKFKSISEQFLRLSYKLTQGDPYLDILIDIKTQINTKKVNTPTLTEYASGGFPTDMIIVTDAMKLLKKLSIIDDRNNTSDTIWDFVKNFIIITPQSNVSGLTGVYRQIGKSLGDGDFDNVARLIKGSPDDTQKLLQELKILISDKKAIYSEIKALNNIIIDTVFKQPHHDNMNE